MQFEWYMEIEERWIWVRGLKKTINRVMSAWKELTHLPIRQERGVDR